MTHGSLFSGIGGFDLAAEWMGWENIFHCEWMPFPRKLLKHYWPKAISYENICTTDFSVHRGEIDILTGGFPCQPYSTAGKRLGKADERHLFPHMLRAIKEIQPRWVIGENVRGLVSWNGGMVFDEVCSDLEREGYEVQPFLIPAASVNAPHQRQRIWFVAYSNNTRNTTLRGGTDGDGKAESSKRQQPFNEFNGQGNEGDAANSESKRSTGHSERTKTSISINGSTCGDGDATDSDGIGLRGQSNRFGKSGFVGKNKQGNYWENFPTQSPICNGDDGLSSRLDGITFSKWRNESIKGGGNAIVPQVALQLFKTIQQIEQLKQRQ